MPDARLAPPGAPQRDQPAVPDRPPRRRGRVLAVIGIAAVLAAVFAAYLSPHLSVQLAQQLWACF